MITQAQSMDYVQSHLAAVITRVRGGSGPLLVTQDGVAAAVIEDARTYERTQEAMAMLKLVALGKHSAATERTYTHKQVFAAARARLKARLADGT